MDRLTKRCGGVAVITDSLEGKYPAEQVIDILAERLAAYEDTGLTPTYVNEMKSDATAMTKELPIVAAELVAAKRDIAALLWLNGECEYCKYGRKEEYSGAERWSCSLGAGNCFPEWRGEKKEGE